MQVLLGTTFKDAEGLSITNDKGVPFTVREAAKQALLGTHQDEQSVSGEEKVKRYDLFLKVKDAVDPADLTAEEVVLIKKLIAKAFTVMVVGQAWKLLEGKLPEEKLLEEKPKMSK